MTNQPSYGYGPPPNQPSYDYGPPPTQPGFPPSYGYIPAAPPRKRRRVFLWIFLAIQALFVVWIVAAIASSAHGIPAYCHQADHSAFIGVKGCTSASEAGATIGVALVIVFWMVVDVILGVSYGVYRLATRPR